PAGSAAASRAHRSDQWGELPAERSQEGRPPEGADRGIAHPARLCRYGQTPYASKPRQSGQEGGLLLLRRRRKRWSSFTSALTLSNEIPGQAQNVLDALNGVDRTRVQAVNGLIASGK